MNAPPPLTFPAGNGQPCVSYTEGTGCVKGHRCATISGDLGDFAQGVGVIGTVASNGLNQNGSQGSKQTALQIGGLVQLVSGESCIPEDKCGTEAAGIKMKCTAHLLISSVSAMLALGLSL